MTAVTFPLRPPRLAFAICGRRWQNDVYEIKYSVCVWVILISSTFTAIVMPLWKWNCLVMVTNFLEASEVGKKDYTAWKS